MSSDPRTIVFFDGECVLCNSSVDFLIKRDLKRNLHYSSLQGKTAQNLLDPKDRNNLDSAILIKKGEKYKRSTAALLTISSLGGLYKAVLIFFVLPRFVRDFFYNLLAANRYRLFGKRETCRIPTKKEEAYLLP